MTFLVPLILSPVWISHLYWLELQDQRRQIWLDNASINLGRDDRSLFNQIETTTKRLETLHEIYHAAQLCQLAPQTALFCNRLAHRLRRSLANALNTVFKLSQMNWKYNGLKALGILKEKEYQGNLKRSEKIPLVISKCGICQNFLVMKIQTKQLITTLSLHQALTPPNLITLRTEKERVWNYQVH